MRTVTAACAFHALHGISVVVRIQSGRLGVVPAVQCTIGELFIYIYLARCNLKEVKYTHVLFTSIASSMSMILCLVCHVLWFLSCVFWFPLSRSTIPHVYPCILHGQDGYGEIARVKGCRHSALGDGGERVKSENKQQLPRKHSATKSQKNARSTKACSLRIRQRLFWH